MGTLKAIGICCVMGSVLFVLICAGFLWMGQNAQEASQADPGRPSLTASPVLYCPQGKPHVVARDEQANRDLFKAIKAKDNEGLEELLRDDRVFVVSCKAAIRILDRGLLTTEVRVLSGEHKGQKGIVANEEIAGGGF